MAGLKYKSKPEEEEGVLTFLPGQCFCRNGNGAIIRAGLL
jgi:hypothetical protein